MVVSCAKPRDLVFCQKCRNAVLRLPKQWAFVGRVPETGGSRTEATSRRSFQFLFRRDSCHKKQAEPEAAGRKKFRGSVVAQCHNSQRGKNVQECKKFQRRKPPSTEAASLSEFCRKRRILWDQKPYFFANRCTEKRASNPTRDDR